jgi:hypothetical protein
MYDVNFQPLVVSDREGVDQYAAQDLETQEVGDAVPFTSDFQSGFVYLAYDFIAPTPTECDLHVLALHEQSFTNT